MSKPKLYIFVGFPGAGKTSMAKIIQEATGAIHLWADNERWQMFGTPTHHDDESRKLYEYLNDKTAQLLNSGKSVLFDTNFNHRFDRDHLRAVAQKNNADTVLIWLTTPADVARDRAVHSKDSRNGYTMNMTPEEFENITAKLEPPSEDENPLKFDGTKFDIPEVLQHLKLT